MCWRPTVDGQLVYQPWLQATAETVTAIKDWTFASIPIKSQTAPEGRTYDRNLHDFSELPDRIANAIESEVLPQLRSNIHPNFLRR
jgi:hypothetical protein